MSVSGYAPTAQIESHTWRVATNAAACWTLNYSVAAMGALVAVVACLLVRLAMWFSGDFGPLFFRPERVGRDGRLFRPIKFRTLKHLDGGFVTSNDDNRTWLGRFLRPSHLDELPQFFNVLAGQMNVVGYRPMPETELPGGIELALSQYPHMFRQGPGITGYAQTRPEVERAVIETPSDHQTMLRLARQFDEEFAATRTILGLLKVMVVTIPVMMRRHGL
ncbi:MAG TPA: sugar transferase [Candidatus Saccharimonadia bacterium]|nr:sugar transferase [Candidatus Saccharimonadia bacterium]